MPRGLSPEEVQANQDRLAVKYGPETTLYGDMEQKYHTLKQTYYYVYGLTKKGKKVFLGPHMSMQEADVLLSDLDDGEIFESPSRSLATATREIKATLLERTHKADEALERMKHQIPEEKIEKKKRSLFGRR